MMKMMNLQKVAQKLETLAHEGKAFQQNPLLIMLCLLFVNVSCS